LVQRPPRGQFIAGLALAGVGTAGLITGYVLLAPRVNVANAWIDQVDAGAGDTSEQQKWLNFNAAIALTSSIGAAALIAAMPLALPKKRKTPWWAWFSGGLGVGLAAFSIAYGVTADSEPGIDCIKAQVDTTQVRTCVRRGEQVGLAILTGLTAAPALTVPLVYLFRRSEKEIVPSVEASRLGGRISVRGRF
jgi:hypothetical protein